jgi:hypothetical protein
VPRGRAGDALSSAGRAFVRFIDSILVRAHHVEEFTQNPECIFRIALGRATVSRTLSDGTQVCRGDTVCEFHLWNERLPLIDPDGPELAWGRAFLSGVTRSLRLMSDYLDHDSRFDGAVAVHGVSAAMGSVQVTGIERTSRGLGFDFEWVPLRSDPWGRFALFWERLYHYALIWTFNPGSLRTKRLSQLKRYQIWMPRQTLRRRYGGGERHRAVIREASGD